MGRWSAVVGMRGLRGRVGVGVNVTITVVVVSSGLYVIAAVDQYLRGSLPGAALYGCFCMTNLASLWLALRG